MTTPGVQSQIPSAPRRINRIVKKIIWSLFGVLVLFIIGSLGLSYYVGWNLTHPVRKPVKVLPEAYGLGYQSISFPATSDHVQLNGWLIPADKPTDKVVIIAHGYRENRSSEKQSLPVAKALHESGFSVLMFDFRDEGESQGKEVTVGLNEANDLLGAVSYAKQNGYSRVGIFGMSMGASTALEATAKNPDIAATVADSPFADLHTYLSDQMPVWTHLPNFPFTSEILFEMRVFNGLDSQKVSPLADLEHLKPRPVMLIAGTADKTISMQNSINLYNEIKQNKDDSLWIIPGAAHIGGYKVQPQQYVQRIVQFFATYLNS